MRTAKEYLEEADRWLTRIANDNGSSYTTTLESYSKIALTFIEMAKTVSTVKIPNSTYEYPGY